MPIVRRKRDKNLSFGVGGNVGEKKLALAFFRAALAKRDQAAQAAQAAIGFSVCWKTEKAWCVFKIKPGADNETHPRILRRNVRAHDARKRIAVGDCNCRKPQRLCLRHELFSVRRAAQKRKIRRNLKFGVLHGSARLLQACPAASVMAAKAATHGKLP